MYGPSIAHEPWRLIARLASRTSCFSTSRSVCAHLHSHRVVIGGVFDATPTGGVVFHATTGLEANAIAQVQAHGRRRLLRVFVRRGLLPGDDVRAMGQWQHRGGFSVDGSVRIEATDRAGRERLLRYCALPPFTMEPPPHPSPPLLRRAGGNGCSRENWLATRRVSNWPVSALLA